ncbi:MAG: LacI family transcriptional regulator [Phycisphaerae bacterium]|nr:LacI family transcriptional regulator [Phycisphaerae bacterium]
MSVTIYDVARKAVVSVSTVSRVLNNNPIVKAERKQRVLSAMEELDYTPNRWARGIRKGSTGKQTGQIAMLIINRPHTDLHQAYMMQYIHGVQQEIAKAGRKCFFVTWDEKSDGDTIPNVLLDGDVDGIIVKGIPHSEIGKQWLSRFPKVFINPPSAVPDNDCVMIDYEEGTRRCVAYLESLGHRRISLVAMQSFHTKLLGYRQAINELGLDADEGLIQVRDIPIPLKSPLDMDWAIENLWSLPKPPTAILSHDYFCSAIYTSLANRGLKIPDDVSIIGYDNVLACCGTLVPSLTSMDIGAFEVGKAAAKQLFERIGDPQERSRKIYIQGRLVERDSVRDISIKESLQEGLYKKERSGIDCWK